MLEAATFEGTEFAASRRIASSRCLLRAAPRPPSRPSRTWLAMLWLAMLWLAGMFAGAQAIAQSFQQPSNDRSIDQGPAYQPPADWSSSPPPPRSSDGWPAIPTDPSLPPPPPGWDRQVFWPNDGEPEELLPPLTKYRDGFFQRLFVSASWLPRLDRDLGITELEAYTTVALPAPSREFPLLITPSFRYFGLDGPPGVDVPAEVFDSWLDFMWVPRLSEKWQAIISVAPGVYADFDSYGSDAFRITGRGILRYQMRPDQLEFFAGILYLNRDDYQIFPAGGVLWVPNRDTRLEIFFPKPKFARRYRFGQRFEDWVYLAGEFGGNTYWVRRDSGAEDLITLRDWRAYMGTERKWDGGSFLRFEIGYIFSRVIEYRSEVTDYPLRDTLMLRISYAH